MYVTCAGTSGNGGGASFKMDDDKN
jgi:hypothetical protein